MRRTRTKRWDEQPEDDRSNPLEDDRPEPTPFWESFTAADMRSLLVTIAGTVIGGILVVMVVGLALVFVRWVHRGPHRTEVIVITSILGVLMGGVFWAFITLGLPVIRKRVIVVVIGLYLSVGVLFGLGLAAGIH